MFEKIFGFLKLNDEAVPDVPDDFPDVYDWEVIRIQSECHECLKLMLETPSIEAFVDFREKYYKAFAQFNTMIKRPGVKPSRDYDTLKEHKYFMHNYYQIQYDLADRFIEYIERTLLRYSTPRGKVNNLNKLYAQFKYFAPDLNADVVNYLDATIKDRFKEYLYED